MLTEAFTEAFLVLLVAIALDLALGELPKAVHPTTFIAKLTMFLERFARGGSPLAEKVKGALLAVAVVGVTAFLTWLLAVAIKENVATPLRILILAALLKPSFALRCMEDFVKPIALACARGDFDEARRHLPLVVRRDPWKLTDSQVISAAVETIAEGTVDGFTSAVFFYALAGLPGAMAFRAISTLDSLVGYKEPRYVNVGWFSAKLDTLANFLPARLTAALMTVASLLASEEWRSAWKVALRDHSKTESVNAGWPMAAMAGALRVQLEKPGHYVLGDGVAALRPEHIFRALKLMKITCFLFTFLIAAQILWARMVLLEWLVP